MNYTTLTVPGELGDTMKGEVTERSLYEHLQQVTDHRKLRGRRYEAAVVLTLLVLAKMAGEKKISGIAHWVRLRGGWLSERLLQGRRRLPCVNTYRYVMAHADEKELERELCAFMEKSSAKKEESSAGKGEVAASRGEDLPQIVIDGKVLCGTDRQTPVVQAPQMVVSAYHVQERRILAQQGALGRGKEKQTALQILQHLSIAGHVLSADALHTTPHWCQQVRHKQAHYLLIAKKNRQELYDDIALLFADGPFPDLPEQQAQTIDKGHGRLEIRRLRISSALTDYLKPGWPDVAQVFQVQRLMTRCGHATDELAYGFTSLSAAQASPPQVLQFIRRHWHIENILHYRRDATLGEDACLVAHGQTPRILALLNNTVLFLIDRAGGADNAAAKIREFAASPQSALDLILHPP